MWFLVVIGSLIFMLSSVIVSYSSWPPFPISFFLMFQNMFELVPPCSISLSICCFVFLVISFSTSDLVFVWLSM